MPGESGGSEWELNKICAKAELEVESGSYK